MPDNDALNADRAPEATGKDDSPVGDQTPKEATVPVNDAVGTDEPQTESAETADQAGGYPSAEAATAGPPEVEFIEPDDEPAGAAEAAVDSPAETDAASVDERLEEIAREQQRLTEYFDEKLRLDASRDEMIDRLHGELQDHRSDMMKKVLLPVLRDLIRLNDQLRKFVEARRGYSEDQRDWGNLLENVLSFGEDIVDILDRYGLATFEESGDKFNPRTQRAVSTTDTDDATLDKTIAERLRPGFRWDEQIIRSEEVVVFRAR